MPLAPSELILNEDGSIYHLCLRPEDIAKTIIFVGDPERVPQVSKHFDRITVCRNKREFHTHTGYLNEKKLTVISTGIGTDNIDIVLNELDALVNIDFESQTIKKERTILDIVRIGTSGAVQPDIPVDSFLLSEFALGLDGLMHHYQHQLDGKQQLAKAFVSQTKWAKEKAVPYSLPCDENLKDHFTSNRIRFGVTVTNTGFYGPQGRNLRLRASNLAFFEQLTSFRYGDHQITNLEMETSGIYLLASLLGHRAVSLNAILANRATGAFSIKASETVQELIQYALDRLASARTEP